MTHTRQPLIPAAHLLPHGLVAIVVVALALSLVVLGCRSPTPTSEIPTATPTPTREGTRIALQTDTPAPGSPTPATPTSTATPTPCPSPPAGWVPYTVEPGDTLSELAALAGVTQEEVMQVNCLTSAELMAGQILVLPPLPTPTPCGDVPAGWVPYTVQPGDTLFGLASLAGVSQEQVMRVNCLDSAALMAGQALYLPPLPTATPTPCVASPPAGWVAYTVRPGDTLFALAVIRGTTTEEVMRVNCLVSSAIVDGDLLYLPPLPIPVEPAGTSGVGPVRPTAGLPVWTLEVPGPGAGSYKACENTPIGVDMLAPPYPRPAHLTAVEMVEVGERRYFFACGYAAPADASVTFDNGQKVEVRLLDALPNRELDMNTAQAVIDWPVLPDHPLGVTTVTITDTNGQSMDTQFESVSPTQQHILIVVPDYLMPTRLNVYYVYFDHGSSLTFGFYRQDRPPGRDYTATKRDEWSVLIDQPLANVGNKGWAQRPLVVETASGPAALVIVYDPSRYGLYWWLPW